MHKYTTKKGRSRRKSGNSPAGNGKSGESRILKLRMPVEKTVESVHNFLYKMAEDCRSPSESGGESNFYPEISG